MAVPQLSVAVKVTAVGMASHSTTRSPGSVVWSNSGAVESDVEIV